MLSGGFYSVLLLAIAAPWLFLRNTKGLMWCTALIVGLCLSLPLYFLAVYLVSGFGESLFAFFLYLLPAAMIAVPTALSGFIAYLVSKGYDV